MLMKTFRLLLAALLLAGAASAQHHHRKAIRHFEHLDAGPCRDLYGCRLPGRGAGQLYTTRKEMNHIKGHANRAQVMVPYNF